MPLPVQIRSDITGSGPRPKRPVKTFNVREIWSGIPYRRSASPPPRTLAGKVVLLNLADKGASWLNVLQGDGSGTDRDVVTDNVTGIFAASWDPAHTTSSARPASLCRVPELVHGS
jgi:hypothetical protein